MNASFSMMRDTVRRQVSTDLSKHKVQIHPVKESEGTPTNNPSSEPLRRKYNKAQSFSAFNFIPTIGHAMEDWTTIPEDHHESSGIIFNSITLPFKWVVWTSKALSGLPPHQSLRERLCNQSASLGSVAGLYLVIAISGFFLPPVARNDVDKILVDIFGVLMFLSAMSLTVYICLALTVMYPLLESIPDFAAMEAYRSLAERWGGYENFLFNIGCQAVLVAMIVAATVIYNQIVLIVMLGTFAVLYFIAAFMTREFFIAIDPITSVHMGLCNAPNTIHRAKALAQAIRDRHREFMEDENNFPEYAAMHYLDPSVKKTAAIKELASEGAREDAAEAPRRPESDRNELQPKARYHVNPRYQYETVPAGPAGAGASAENTDRNREADGQGIENVEETREDEKNEPGPVDEVTDFAETGATAGRGATAAGVPSLEDILLGERGLLFIAQAPRVTVVACEAMHKVLVGQGCVSTDHLVELMRFSRQGSVGSGGSAGESGNGSAGGSQALVLMQSMGIGAFHAMALIKYINSLLAQHKL